MRRRTLNSVVVCAELNDRRDSVLVSDDSETAAAGGGETEAAGGERSDVGENSERRSRSVCAHT